jgi:hypothetical protein
MSHGEHDDTHPPGPCDKTRKKAGYSMSLLLIGLLQACSNRPTPTPTSPQGVDAGAPAPPQPSDAAPPPATWDAGTIPIDRDANPWCEYLYCYYQVALAPCVVVCQPWAPSHPSVIGPMCVTCVNPDTVAQCGYLCGGPADGG